MRKILKDLDALLVTNPTNVRYLTGFVGAADNEREAYCLVTKSHTYLITTALYAEYVKDLVIRTKRGSNNPIIQLSNKPIKKTVTELVANLSIKKFGFEENDLTVAEYHKIMHEHKNVTFLPTKDRVETLRMIKREDEIEHIRRAAKLTDQCFDFILGKIKPGVIEKEIAWEIESFIRSRGAQLAFSPIVAFGKNTSQPHYNANFTRPGEALKKQDIALLDFGVRINGYCSDMTRVVFIGNPDDEWVKAYEAVKNAQAAALNTIHNNPDQVARNIIRDAGFPVYPHSLGHGVGLDIHEAPRLTVKKNVALKPGMVVTIEPAVYIEGNYGIRIEDLVLLKKDGIDMLSQSKKDIIIL